MDDLDPRVDMLRTSWGRVVSWCNENAPVTARSLHGPADEASLVHVQNAMALRWPAQLVAWLRLSNGTDPSSTGEVLPSYRHLGAEDLLAAWCQWDDIVKALGRDEDRSTWESGPAGSQAHLFLRPWVPIAADGLGNFLFVDLRPGPKHGCVGEYLHDQGFLRDPLWDDLAEMISEAAEGLTAGLVVAGRKAQVENGVVRWHTIPSHDESPTPALDDLRIRLLMLSRGPQRDVSGVAARLNLTPKVVDKWLARFIDRTGYEQWPGFVAKTPVGSRVIGTAFSSHPFGVYVDIGLPYPAALRAEHMTDDVAVQTTLAYPPVGSRIEGVVLKHRPDIGHVEIDTRPSSLALTAK